jgi:hypothetical protein
MFVQFVRYILTDNVTFSLVDSILIEYVNYLFLFLFYVVVIALEVL